MKLLNLKLPTTYQLQWVSKEAKEKWEEKFKLASKVYNILELETVVHDVRKCMIAHNVNPNKLEEYTNWLAKKGLIFVPLQKEKLNNGGGFSHAISPYKDGKEFVYRGVISKSLEYINEFVEAHHKRDDIKIGELLGFPKCCCEEFDKNWKSGYIDPIWQAAENTKQENIEFKANNDKLYIIKIKNSNLEASPLLRYAGIRIISHLPCSFDCKETEKVTQQWIEVGKKLKIKGLEEAIEFLNMPVEWDCLKGVAEIRTPLFKIVANSVPCYPQYIVQIEGKFYPKEAPNGLRFPWKNNIK